MLAVFAGYSASFACLVAERRAAGLRPDGRSHCACGQPIPMYRNIPVITWLLQTGRATCCGARIPTKYFVAETLTVAVAVILAALWGWLAGVVATGVCMAATILLPLRGSVPDSLRRK